MADSVQIRRGVYYDSVSLMQVSRDVAAAPGVSAALVAMGTELNLDLLAGMGFTAAEPVGPNDLLVAVRGQDAAALEAGLAALEDALAALKAAGSAAGGVGEGCTARPVISAAASSATRSRPELCPIASAAGRWC